MKRPYSIIAGAIAILVALYHAFDGEQVMAALPLDSVQFAFVLFGPSFAGLVVFAFLGALASTQPKLETL